MKNTYKEVIRSLQSVEESAARVARLLSINDPLQQHRVGIRVRRALVELQAALEQVDQ